MIKVPEGWARREISGGASFHDKYNTIVLAVSQHPDPLTLTSAKQNEISKLEKAGKAVRVSHVKSVDLPSGSAVVVSYGSNSERNPVTNKAIRLENERIHLEEWQARHLDDVGSIRGGQRRPMEPHGKELPVAVKWLPSKLLISIGSFTLENRKP